MADLYLVRHGQTELNVQSILQGWHDSPLTARGREQALTARTACAEEFIMQLPDGLDTVIGENGAGLSEGQAQRIAVARAVYSGADFLLMDEATSALDADTEYRLLKNIAALDGKTALIVTHRPAALEICSRKFILKDGVINEQC